MRTFSENKQTAPVSHFSFCRLCPPDRTTYLCRRSGHLRDQKQQKNKSICELQTAPFAVVSKAISENGKLVSRTGIDHVAALSAFIE